MAKLARKSLAVTAFYSLLWDIVDLSCFWNVDCMFVAIAAFSDQPLSRMEVGTEAHVLHHQDGDKSHV